MVVEILKELLAVYRRWHAKHKVLSGLVFAILALLALQIAWAGRWWLASVASLGRQRHAVVGRVTWQGQPLENGIISFRPLEDQPFNSGATIQQGVFTISRAKGLVPGKYRVRIHASKADPSLPPPAEGERDMRPGVEVLPRKYNVASELTAEIGSWGTSTVSFDLVP